MPTSRRKSTTPYQFFRFVAGPRLRGRTAAVIRQGRLESSMRRQYLSAMFRQVLHVLMAVVVALAATLPVSVNAMPTRSAVNGMASDQPCSSCPQHRQTGHINPLQVPPCQILACAGPLAMLAAPASVHEPAFLRVVYGAAPLTRHPKTGPSPDPFPPKPIVLR